MPELPELELDENHVYRLDGVVIPGCTQVLKAMGCTPGFNFMSEDQLEFYRSRGHAVHKAVELSIRGELDKRTLDQREVKPYLVGWERFCNDHRVDVVEIKRGSALSDLVGRDGFFTEIPLHHKSFRYGVTPDVIGCIDGQYGVIEIKATSAHAPATGLQLAAQLFAVRGLMADFGTQRIGLRLLKDEPYYDMRHYTEKSDEAVWLSLLNSYNWLTKHKLLRQNGGR